MATLFSLCSLLLLANSLLAQAKRPQEDPHFTQLYQTYKQRFNERFIVVGEGPGESLPIATINHDHCQYYWNYQHYSTHEKPFGCYYQEQKRGNGHGVMLLGGDATVSLGFYIANLASEMAVNDYLGESNEKNIHDLYFALKAYYRLEKKASEIFGQKEVYKGFYMRSDAMADFWKVYNEKNNPSMKLHCVVDALTCNYTYYKGDLVEILNHGVINSHDQSIRILFGLAFVKRFVGEEVAYQGESLLPMAQDIANRIVGRLHKGKWKLVAPNGVKGNDILGGNSMAYGYAIDLMGEYITGKRHGKYCSFCNDIVYKWLWELSGLGNSVHFNKMMVFVLATVSDSRSWKRFMKITTRDEMYLYPIASAILHNRKFTPLEKQKVLEPMKKLLAIAPPDGTCYSRPDDKLHNHLKQVRGWMADFRWSTGNVNSLIGENKHARPGEHYGLDVMLAINLHRLYDFMEKNNVLK